MGEGGMKLIEVGGRDGTLEIEVVLIDNVGIDRPNIAVYPLDWS